MKKKINMPSFLSDYSSFWNPLMGAFLPNIIAVDDNDHGLHQRPMVGLNYSKPTQMIEATTLMSFGAKRVNLSKNEVLFRAGADAIFYHQLVSGSVKMLTMSREGQEFIQGVFSAGDSFGEPPLFCNFPYPSTAIAIEDSVVWKLSKGQFFELLKNNFDIHIAFDRVLCHRLKYKSMILSDISFHDPEHRITNLLRYLKDTDTKKESNLQMIRNTKPYTTPFTRQQLADMSGLRVETVIRTVKKMQEKGKLKIVGRKITI
ncbi:MAG: Crp/Fnr family transcriptional regulator [Cyclobacteriaceae bacterium]